MKKKLILAVLSLSVLFQLSLAQLTIFNTIPEWKSNSMGHYATGLGVADINQDGWEDIVVANGNDMSRQSLVVYYNNGDGTFPVSPSWSSSDIDYHGHLSIGDVNGDNLPDVAVSVFLGPAGFSEPGHAKIYFNQGSELESTPSFQTSDKMFTFSCTLGDADGDGDLDLAVACGEPYDGHFAYGKIYYNQNGIMQTLPSWQSQVLMGALDVDFADFDNNGFLDIVFACHLTPNYIFLADSSGYIPAAHSWTSMDNNYYANSLTIAHLDSNEVSDLIISDNSQLGGHGKYKAYLFDSAPKGQSNPAWYSNAGGYGSAVLAEDLDFDSHPELVAGRWWGKVELFSGITNSFSSNPSWSSQTNSVIEAFALRDIDHDGRLTRTDTIIIPTDSIHVCYLSQMSVEGIISVYLNNQLLSPGNDYSTLPGSQWISLKQVLNAGDSLIIEYEYSMDRDLVVSNWDPDIGNYLFYNQTNPTSIYQESNHLSEVGIKFSPNPFNQACQIEIFSSANTILKIDIYDINGRFVKKIFNGDIQTGINTFLWTGQNENGNNVSSGTYFLKVLINEKNYTRKLLLLR